MIYEVDTCSWSVLWPLCPKLDGSCSQQKGVGCFAATVICVCVCVCTVSIPEWVLFISCDKCVYNCYQGGMFPVLAGVHNEEKKNERGGA